MREHPLPWFLYVACGILVIYLFTYCGLIKRTVVRTPPVSVDGERRTQLIPVPVFRGFAPGEDRVCWKILSPALTLDRKLVRREYWKTQVEVEKIQQTQP
jgi:hypothetical protein